MNSSCDIELGCSSFQYVRSRSTWGFDSGTLESLAALAITNPNHQSTAVDVLRLETQTFTDSQSECINGRQGHPSHGMVGRTAAARALPVGSTPPVATATD
ncbi:MAG: hypothetical protein QM784_30530 [Polyangiaceae bacterium]